MTVLSCFSCFFIFGNLRSFQIIYQIVLVILIYITKSQNRNSLFQVNSRINIVIINNTISYILVLSKYIVNQFRPTTFSRLFCLSRFFEDLNFFDMNFLFGYCISLTLFYLTIFCNVFVYVSFKSIFATTFTICFINKIL